MGNKLSQLKITKFVLLFSALMSVHCGTTSRSRHPDITSGVNGTRYPAGVVPVEPRGLKLMWPIASHRVSQNFKSDEDGRHPHDGIDLPAPQGTRIYAPADGTVIYAGHKFHGYGKMIMIEHSLHLTTLFGHCQKLFVKSGEAVHKGNLIALVGRTGHATAPHLHFEVRINRDPVDPLAYLP